MLNRILYFYLVAFKFLWIFSPLNADTSEISIVRDHQSLQLSWFGSQKGEWAIEDELGHTCTSGEYQIGPNEIHIEKPASNVQLKLKLKEPHSSDYSREVLIDSLKNLSPLPRPLGSAIIYQLPVRTFFADDVGRPYTGNLSQLTRETIQTLKGLNIDYLWLTGILEAATPRTVDPDAVKGDAGSYYAIHDAWDLSREIGNHNDFARVIEDAHNLGVRVIVDLVVNHTARIHRTDIICKTHLNFGSQDIRSTFFNPANNYYYIQGSSFTPPLQPNALNVDGQFDIDIDRPGIQLEYPALVTGNDTISASPEIDDWFETVKLNYGFNFLTKRGFYDPIPLTWKQMKDVAIYWLEKGVDGFRIDYAHAIPTEFYRYFVEEIKSVQPNAFLIAEAYESDERMRVPDFRYENLFEVGVDTIYNSTLYWAMRNQAKQPGRMPDTRLSESPAFRHEILSGGFEFTNYLENHDELRLAHDQFFPWISNSTQRAWLGFGYSSYVALLPGNFLLHGGQEIGEDARISGRYAGNSGRNSIFDYVFQFQTRNWLRRQLDTTLVDLRRNYQRLTQLKTQPPFNQKHSHENPTYFDLHPMNHYKNESKWVGAYLRIANGQTFIVVSNTDPYNAHQATLHFTNQPGIDSHGLLSRMNIQNNDQRYVFKEALSFPGWIPKDPNISGTGIPGWALYQSGGIPSGFFIETIPPGTTYAFIIEP